MPKPTLVVAQAFVVVTNCACRLLSPLLETKHACAYCHPVIVGKVLLVSLMAIDENFVRAASQLTVNGDAVNDLAAVLGYQHVRVVAGGARIVKNNAIIRRSTDGARRRRVSQRVFPLAPARVLYMEERH
ncbi:MAG: hypothetical protein WKF84_21095 [Pyrinomonadaceae bacterium]